MNDTCLIIEEDFDQLISEAERLCDRRNTDVLQIIGKAEEIARLTEDRRQQALVSYLYAYHQCFINNNYDQAISHLLQLLFELDAETFAAIGYKPLMTLGNSYQLKGDVFSAQESYLKGLRCLENKPRLTQPEEVFLASFNYNLSVLLSSSELKIESEEYITKAISLYIKHNKKFQLSKCYVAYARFFDVKGDFTTAIQYIHKAIEIDETINDPYSISFSKANLGILLLKINDYDRALICLQEALDFYEQKNLFFETAMVKFELGQAYQHTSAKETGLEYINAAERAMLTLDNRKELTEIYKVKAQVLANLGHMAGAYEYQQKYIENLRFFFDNEKNNALTRAKKEFESELKEKEAQLLRQKNEEIQEYVQKLEISNNELKQFAHVASHDLREPLRMITSYISLLDKSMKDKLSEQDKEFFKYVLDGSKRMDQLIRDLLRLAKVDANATVEKIKLNSVIEEIKLNLETLVKDNGAKIEVGNMPAVYADRAQMLQLFQNLVANGIKYNKSHPPCIRINCIDRKDNIEITVTDNGIGIPRHLRDEAFQIFRRLHRLNDATGSGIGLAICKKVVEGLKGKISISDAPGGGTTFHLLFGKEILKPMD